MQLKIDAGERSARSMGPVISTLKIKVRVSPPGLYGQLCEALEKVESSTYLGSL